MQEVLPKKAQGTSEVPFRADCPQTSSSFHHVVHNHHLYRGRGVSSVVVLHVSVYVYTSK